LLCLQANDLVAERGAAVVALETQLAAAVERADAAEDGLEEARLDIAELKRVNDVQVRISSISDAARQRWRWG
jgi:hypothetical protein